MNEQSRRDFLNDVGRGMILTGLGASLAAELGVGAMAREGDTDLLDFGKLRPLVGLMQNTNVNKLQPILVKKLKAGQTDLKSLIAAAALANAETFGGQDYVGFHTEMALLPALQMSKELPTERQALPILKVLYRNTARIQETGRKKTLHPIEAAKLSKEQNGPQKLRDAVRAGRIKEADAIFAATMSQKELDQAYNDMMWYVQDDTDIHQFVLAHRAYVLIDVVGKDHAHTLLRQSVRQCAHHASQRNKRKNYDPSIRRDIPKLVDQYKLLGIKIGKRDPGDKWVAKMAQTIYENDRYKAAEAIAASLAEGISPEVIGEAI